MRNAPPLHVPLGPLGDALALIGRDGQLLVYVTARGVEWAHFCHVARTMAVDPSERKMIEQAIKTIGEYFDVRDGLHVVGGD